MTAILSAKAWAAVALALILLLAGTHWKAYVMGGNAVQAKWTAEKLTQAEQTLALTAEAAATTDALQQSADQLRKTKNAQIARLNADLSAALAGLSDRPARPGASGVPTDPAAGANPGCTGASLWRDDGEFLAREAARADGLLADLAQCQAAYDSARDALK